MFEGVGSQATKNIADALPGVEKTVTDAVQAVQALVTESLIPIMEEIVTQAITQINRIDGATVTLTPNEKLTVSISPITVSVEIPTFTAAVSMPWKSEK